MKFVSFPWPQFRFCTCSTVNTGPLSTGIADSFNLFFPSFYCELAFGIDGIKTTHTHTHTHIFWGPVAGRRTLTPPLLPLPQAVEPRTAIHRQQTYDGHSVLLCELFQLHLMMVDGTWYIVLRADCSVCVLCVVCVGRGEKITHYACLMWNSLQQSERMTFFAATSVCESPARRIPVHIYVAHIAAVYECEVGGE